MLCIHTAQPVHIWYIHTWWFAQHAFKWIIHIKKEMRSLVITKKSKLYFKKTNITNYYYVGKRKIKQLFVFLLHYDIFIALLYIYLICANNLKHELCHYLHLCTRKVSLFMTNKSTLYRQIYWSKSFMCLNRCDQSNKLTNGLTGLHGESV